MNREMKERLSAVLYLGTFTAVLSLSVIFGSSLPISREAALLLGFSALSVGMILVAWAVSHLKKGFLGEVRPYLDYLVKEGPYRFVRHPIYLGMFIALLGFAFWLRSVFGLIGATVLFLPSEIYRATLEEESLTRKFGARWEDYVEMTGFILPEIRD